MWRGRRRFDNVQRALTKTALRRLVKRIDERIYVSCLSYEELRGITKMWLYEILPKAITFATAKTKRDDAQPFRVRAAHILAALRRAPGNYAKTQYSIFIYLSFVTFASRFLPVKAARS